MKMCRIATIPGDGIGKEVLPAGRQALEALTASKNAFSFESEEFDWGDHHYREHGEMMPADRLKALLQKNAIASRT